MKQPSGFLPRVHHLMSALALTPNALADESLIPRTRFGDLLNGTAQPLDGEVEAILRSLAGATDDYLFLAATEAFAPASPGEPDVTPIETYRIAAGTRFGKLEVLEGAARSQHLNGKLAYRVRCECGSEKLVRAQALREGRTRSCGAKGCRERRGAVDADAA